MRILALVPARGGSKRLPRKNIRILGGKPLINWTIEVAKGIPEICEILVSTDDPEIASIAKSAGATVPWLRPKILATDESTSAEVALHALDWYETDNEKIDGVLLLQPTTPFRTRESIQEAISLFRTRLSLTVVGVTPTKSHPMWTFKEQGAYLVPFLELHDFKSRSQDLPTAYALNGCIYLISPQELRIHKSFITPSLQAIVIGSLKESLDIDVEEDFQLAKLLISIE